MELNDRVNEKAIPQKTALHPAGPISCTFRLISFLVLALFLNLSSSGVGSSVAHAATFSFNNNSPIAVSESDQVPTLTLRLSGPEGCRISGVISFSGTATIGSDYNADIPPFSMLAGSSIPVPIQLLDDTIPEPTEDINISVGSINPVACEGETISSIANKTITITDDDLPVSPEARDDPDIQTRIDQPVTIDVIANDVENGLPIEIFEVTEPANGTAIPNLSNTITYTPNAGFVGTDSFVYSITDGVNISMATVTVTVTPGITDTVDDGAGLPGEDNEEEQQPVPLPQAIDLSCTAGASELLKQRCRELAVLSPDALAAALNDISARQIPAQGTHLVEIGATQIRNIERRLISLRRGQSDVLDLQELSLKVGRDVIPGSIISAAVFEQQSSGEETTDEGVRENPDEVRVDDGNSPVGVFIGGLIDSGDKENTRKEAGFDFSTYGLTIGADYRLSPDQVIGAALGFADTSSDFVDSSGTNDSDALTASLYGSYHVPEVFFVDWILSAGEADFQTNRVIRYTGFETQTDGDTQGNFLGLGITAGLEKHIGGGWILSPYGRLELLKLDIDQYVERGGDGLALIVDEQNIDSLKLAVAAELSKAIKTRTGSIVPSFYIEWENQLADSEREILASLAENPVVPFAIETDSPDSSYFVFGASVTAILRERFAGYVSLESRAGQDDIRKNSLNLGVRITF